MTTGSVEYAYARIAARHGQRPDEVHWHRIESMRTLAALLETVRATSLEHWVVGLTPLSDPHAIDGRLREHWRALVGEIVRWMPARWQPATAWWATLPDIPVVAHLAAGGRALPWMFADPHYRPLVAADARLRNPLASLIATTGAPASVAAVWHAEWKRRLPRGDAGPLSQLERIVGAHLIAFHALPPGDGTALRRSLTSKLATLFREAIATPAATFVFLVLTLLDGERLRGELLRRAAFPGLPLAR
jgi:hypothetical protein